MAYVVRDGTRGGALLVQQHSICPRTRMGKDKIYFACLAQEFVVKTERRWNNNLVKRGRVPTEFLKTVYMAWVYQFRLGR